MFFRGKQPEASIWRRFRASTDGFTFTEADGVYTAHIVANAERVVDLMWTMTELLNPAVDFYIDVLRSGRNRERRHRTGSQQECDTLCHCKLHFSLQARRRAADRENGAGAGPVS